MLPTAGKNDQAGSAIVINPESSPRPPSLGSSSPEIESLLVANLLAQMNTPRVLESPDALRDVDGDAPPKLTPSSQTRPKQNAQSKRAKAAGSSATMEDRLVQMPEKRAMPWREGIEPGADNETGGESRRKQIRFGCLLATRGDIAPVPCHACMKGRGKFNICVVLDGFFKGACASCQLSGRPNRCSIKQIDGKRKIT
jgi:hypothetical protein